MLLLNEALGGALLKDCVYKPSGRTPRIFFQNAEQDDTFAIDEPSVFQNILFLGGAGSGKTNAINQVVAQTRHWASHSGEDSVILIFDTKGDYICHRGFYRPGDLVIANDKQFRQRSAVWNLFDEILADGDSPADYEGNAREISGVYFRGRGSQTQPFFANAARDLFAGALIYFVRRRRDNPQAWEDKLNNQDLAAFLMQYDAAKLMEYLGIYSDLRGLSAYVGDGTSNQALGVLAELRSMLYECFQGVFAGRAKPGESYFSIRREVREKRGQAVFILYDLAIGETLSPVYRILIDLALKEALSGVGGGRVHLFLDELKLLPQLRHLEDALNFGRSKRVSVVAGLQSVGQIYAAYDEKVGQDILSGFGSVIAFHTNDYASRQYISQMYGKNLTAYRYQNAGNHPVDREREGYTVEDWDLLRLRPGQAVVGLASQGTPFPFTFELDRF